MNEAWQAHDNAPQGLTGACAGIEAVQSGRLPRFRLEYDCHFPGQQRWFSMNVTPLGMPGEGGVVITHTNVTERRLAHEQQRLAASVFTHTRVGIITLPDGTIVDVNEAFTRITGYARDDVLGKNPRSLSSGRQDRAFLDLDGFKAGNDQHGHQAGDHLLIALAARMKHVLRDGDTLARMGGDEFVAVIMDLGRYAALCPSVNASSNTEYPAQSLWAKPSRPKVNADCLGGNCFDFDSVLFICHDGLRAI